MWTYSQHSGKLTNPAGVVIATGYSGLGEHKNRPESQYLKGLGPIPVGDYHIGKLYDSPNVGPFTLPLEALPGTDTHGRGDFKIHGESSLHPGASSHGCLIFHREIRISINKSDDRTIRVVP